MGTLPKAAGPRSPSGLRLPRHGEPLTVRIARHPAVRKVRQLASQPRTSDGIMLALGAVVGLGTGLLAVALIELVRAVQAVAFGASPGPVTVVVATTTGGLVVGLLATYLVPEARGGGVTDVMRTIALHSGRMRARVAPGKLVASGIALGTGASGGREGPIVQIGGSVASTVGRAFALSEEQKRALIAAGAAAGIAASFNAPIGGMLFAIEVIIGGFRLRYLQVIVVAAVVASVTARQIVGEALIYNPPRYELGAPAELLLYALVGLAAVAVGLALVRGEHLAEQAFRRLRVWPPLRTALGGLAIGVIALGLPEVLGTGDELPPIPGAQTEPIAAMLAGELGGEGFAAAGVLLLLLVAKLVATCAAIGSGHAVGSFGPSVFLGAALGGAIGQAAAVVLPQAGVRPGALALAGMAAVVAAGSKAPLTGILIAFELTGGYEMVLPLMLAVGAATLVTDRIDRASVYTLPLLREGITYAEPEGIDILQTVKVGEVMTADPEVVPADMTLEQLHRQFRRTRHHGFAVVEGEGDHRRLVGVVTVSDLTRAVTGHTADVSQTGDIMSQPEELRQRTVAEICTRAPLTVTPDDPVFRAVRRMASIDVGRLPVVSSEDHGRLVGLIRRSDIVKAYQRAVTRSVGAQQRQASGKLRDLTGTRFLEVSVDPGAPVAGLEVSEVDWPPRTILTSVRRDGQVIMPHGATVLQAGDEVVALTGDEEADAVLELFTARGDPGGRQPGRADGAGRGTRAPENGTEATPWT